MKYAPPIELTDEERRALEQTVRTRTAPQRDVLRARIILAAAEGKMNREIAAALGCSLPTVGLWRTRFAKHRLEGLKEAPRSGRPRTYGPDKVSAIVAQTLTPPEPRTHWSTRRLARAQGVSHMTVHRIWRRYQLQPHRVETFKYSRDPELEAKVVDIVGLYLHPPENALVLCVDEKSQIQAINRTQPLLPLRPGQVERRSHDYERHGTVTLFAALNLATGEVEGECYRRHRHQEFLRFLRRLDTTHPDGEMHLIVDNYATHKHPTVKRWLQRHPRFTLHFTPTGASWLNLVEIWFGILQSQALRRGNFYDVDMLVATIRRFIEAWKEDAKPFVWVKTPDQILAKARPRER